MPETGRKCLRGRGEGGYGRRAWHEGVGRGRQRQGEKGERDFEVERLF